MMDAIDKLLNYAASAALYRSADGDTLIGVCVGSSLLFLEDLSAGVTEGDDEAGESYSSSSSGDASCSSCSSSSLLLLL